MLYIMRHGKTDWNACHKLQGRTDIPLNDEGRMMAAEAGEKYADIHFDECYSSPLARAKETARFFSKEEEYLYIQMTDLLRWDLEYMRE
nr:histidine phosphatase family protein [Lachnospira eligens]